MPSFSTSQVPRMADGIAATQRTVSSCHERKCRALKSQINSSAARLPATEVLGCRSGVGGRDPIREAIEAVLPDAQRVGAQHESAAPL